MHRLLLRLKWLVCVIGGRVDSQGGRCRGGDSVSWQPAASGSAGLRGGQGSSRGWCCRWRSGGDRRTRRVDR